MESLSVHVLACSCSTAQDSNHTLNLLYLVPTIYGSDGKIYAGRQISTHTHCWQRVVCCFRLFLFSLGAASVAAGSSNIEFVNLEDLVEQPGQLMNRSDRYRRQATYITYYLKVMFVHYSLYAYMHIQGTAFSNRSMVVWTPSYPNYWYESVILKQIQWSGCGPECVIQSIKGCPCSTQRTTFSD